MRRAASLSRFTRRELLIERSYLAWCEPEYLPADLDAAFRALIGVPAEVPAALMGDAR